MKIGIVKENFTGEQRVSGTPKSIARLIKQGFEVVVQSGAGALATFDDDAYREAGAEVVDTAEAVWNAADIITKVRICTEAEAALAREKQVIISLVAPAQNQPLIDKLAERKASLLALDCVPRITRAQSMDVLSSMANIAGYRAVIEAATAFGSFFTGQTTAAGSVRPAKVLVIGAGVAGLAALGAARGLGAIVRAFDTRAAVREQVESLGGEFLEVEFEESGDGGGGYAKVMSPEFIEAEMALFMEQAKEVDIVITTALIPGRKAPILWTEDHVKAMRPGSVIVDMAAENGGNCESTVHGESVSVHGVTVIGYSDLVSRMAHVASDLFGTNISHLTKELGKAEGFVLDHDNEITRGALVLDEGKLLWPPPKKEPALVPAKPSPEPVKQAELPKQAPKSSNTGKVLSSVLALALFAGWIVLRIGSADMAMGAELSNFLQHFTVFVLACFVGWQVVWSVTAALHTPLMSVTNAISGIIIVGGILQAASHHAGGPDSTAVLVGAVATLFATINIFGGFVVTKRMLQMFQK